MSRPWSWTRFWLIATLAWYAVAGPGAAVYFLFISRDIKGIGEAELLVVAAPIMLGMMIKVVYRIGMMIHGHRLG